MTDFPLVIAVCCREWPVALGQRIGRCGFCGERPVIDWTRDVPPAKTPAETTS
jgi:hypothetical protein